MNARQKAKVGPGSTSDGMLVPVVRSRHPDSASGLYGCVGGNYD